MSIKKILAAGLAMTMLSPYAVFAEGEKSAEEAVRDYETFDLQEFGANGVLFGEADTKSEDAEDGAENNLISLRTLTKYHDHTKYHSGRQTPNVVENGVKIWDSPNNRYKLAPTDMTEIIYNKTAMDHFKASDGYIYAALESGEKAPFDISTDTDKGNGILLGGADNPTNSFTMDITDGKYEEILFVSTSSNEPTTNIYVEYTDGTNNKGTEESVQKIYDKKASKPAKPADGSKYPYAGWLEQFAVEYKGDDTLHTAFVYSNITQKTYTSATTDGKTGNKFTDKDGKETTEEVWTGSAYKEKIAPINQPYYVPVYSITVDPTKTVDKIVFSGGDAYRPICIFGVTGVKADSDSAVNYAISALSAANANFETANWATAYKYISFLEKNGTENLSAENLEVYTLAKKNYLTVTKNAEPIDITGSYTEGSIVYRTPQDATFDWSDSANYVHYLHQKTASPSTYKVSYVYNKTVIENLKAQQGGRLHDSNSVPFDVQTTGGIIVGGTYAGQYQTVKIDADKAYSKIAFLASFAGGAKRGVYGTVTYTDGTEESYTTYVNDSTDYTGALFVFADYDSVLSRTDLCINESGGATTTGSYRMGTYTLNVDPTKKIESIKLKLDDSWTGGVIFAMTGFAAQDDEFKVAVIKALEKAQADDYTDWPHLNKYIKDFEDYTGEWTDEQRVVYNAAKAKYAVATNNSRTFDISSAYGNSLAYAKANETVADWDIAGKFVNLTYYTGEKDSAGNNIKGSNTIRAYNKDLVEAMKLSQGGVIHSANNIPFAVDTSGAVILGGNGQGDGATKTIAINADKCYEKLAVLADVTYYNSTYTTEGKITYTDGTEKTFENNDIIGWTSDVSEANLSRISDLFITNENGTTGVGTFYVYEIEVDSTKKVQSISVGHVSQWDAMIILAVTGVGETELTGKALLDAYEAQAEAGTLSADDLEDAYQLFRKLLADETIDDVGDYKSILAMMKEKSGDVTINDYTVEGNTVKVTLDAVTEDGATGVVAYCAVYDGARLTAVLSTEEKDVFMDSEAEDKEAKFEFKTSISGKTVKIFVWDGAQAPVSAALVK